VNTALIGLDFIVDIMHPSGKIARSAEMAAERGIVPAMNRALQAGTERGWLNILVRVGFEGEYAAQKMRAPRPPPPSTISPCAPWRGSRPSPPLMA
jgi:hypothetical protein